MLPVSEVENLIPNKPEDHQTQWQKDCIIVAVKAYFHQWHPVLLITDTVCEGTERNKSTERQLKRSWFFKQLCLLLFFSLDAKISLLYVRHYLDVSKGGVLTSYCIYLSMLFFSECIATGAVVLQQVVGVDLLLRITKTFHIPLKYMTKQKFK